jgi:hypothetical protein
MLRSFDGIGLIRSNCSATNQNKRDMRDPLRNYESQVIAKGIPCCGNSCLVDKAAVSVIQKRCAEEKNMTKTQSRSSR